MIRRKNETHLMEDLQVIVNRLRDHIQRCLNIWNESPDVEDLCEEALNDLESINQFIDYLGTVADSPDSTELRSSLQNWVDILREFDQHYSSFLNYDQVEQGPVEQGPVEQGPVEHGPQESMEQEPTESNRQAEPIGSVPEPEPGPVPEPGSDSEEDEPEYEYDEEPAQIVQQELFFYINSDGQVQQIMMPDGGQDIINVLETIIDQEVMQRVLDESMNDRGGAVEGLQKEKVDAFHRKLFLELGASSDKSEGRCTVCLEAFEGTDVVMILPCDHLFHPDCVTPWFQASTKCPNCKFDLNSQ